MNKFAINEFKRRAKANDHNYGPAKKQSKPNVTKEVVTNEESKTKAHTELPADFFDVKTAKSGNPSNEINEEETSKELPKGFFDDPVMDAKARNVVYKDPKDEEWELFQKAISEEKNVSEALVEEELEVIQLERNLEEIDSQMEQWQKVNELQEKAEQIIAKSDKEMKAGQSGDEDEVEELDDLNVFLFSDWRSRGTIFKK